MSTKLRYCGQSIRDNGEGDYSVLDIAAFAGLFEADIDDFSHRCRRLIEDMDFRYRPLAGGERDEVILDVLRKLQAEDLPVSGGRRRQDWENGWSENLRQFAASGFDLSHLVPAYMRKHDVLRLNRTYIRPASRSFLDDFYTVYRRFFFEKYLSPYDHIYEFGCGTGYNLVIMAQLFGAKKIHGADWARSSVELVDMAAKTHGHDLTGHLFDMFNPDSTLEIAPNSAVITLSSLEQTGDGYEPFLQYLLEKKPAVCINFEPLLELYDPDNLLDYLAIQYHTKRGYLRGYLRRLRQLESDKRIRILKTQRIYFGSRYHEAYSIVI